MPIEITTASEEVKEGIRTALEAAKEDRLTPADWEAGTITTPGTPAPVDIFTAIVAWLATALAKTINGIVTFGGNIIVNGTNPTAPNVTTMSGATSLANRQAIQEMLWATPGTTGAPFARHLIVPMGFTTTLTGSGSFTQGQSAGFGPDTITTAGSKSYGVVLGGALSPSGVASSRLDRIFWANTVMVEFTLFLNNSDLTDGIFRVAMGAGIKNTSGMVTDRGFTLNFYGVNTSDMAVRIGGMPSGLTTGTIPAITDATNASPIVVTTATAHTLSNGQLVEIRDVTGNSGANGIFEVANVTSTTFELVGSTGTGSFSAAGSWQLVSAVLTTIQTRTFQRGIRAIWTPPSTVTLYIDNASVGSLATLGPGVTAAGFNQVGFFATNPTASTRINADMVDLIQGWR